MVGIRSSIYEFVQIGKIIVTIEPIIALKTVFHSNLCKSEMEWLLLVYLRVS